MSWITMKEQANAPTTPAAGYATLYVDANGDFAFKLDDGTVRTISASYTSTTGSAPHATTSSTYAAINDMSLSLGAGTYCLWFNATATQTGNGFTANITVFIDGVHQTQAERSYHNVSSHSHDLTCPIATLLVFTLTSTKTVDVRFKTSGGTLTIGNRSVTVHKGG